MATPVCGNAKLQLDVVLKALPLGLVLALTRLILLLQAMLGLLRLHLRALLAIIPQGAGLIKMRVIGGSRHVRNWALCPSLARMLISWQSTSVLS
jgi:hypothetical protein